MAIDPAQLAQLVKDTEDLVVLFGERHRTDYYAANALIGAALTASVGVVFAGLYEKAKLAAVLGLVSGVLISADAIWVPGDKAQFWRVMEAETVNLRVDLRAVGTDSDRYEKAVAAYKLLKTASAEKIPRGGEMAAVRQLATDLQIKK